MKIKLTNKIKWDNEHKFISLLSEIEKENYLNKIFDNEKEYIVLPEISWDKNNDNFTLPIEETINSNYTYAKITFDDDVFFKGNKVAYFFVNKIRYLHYDECLTEIDLKIDEWVNIKNQKEFLGKFLQQVIRSTFFKANLNNKLICSEACKNLSKNNIKIKELETYDYSEKFDNKRSQYILYAQFKNLENFNQFLNDIEPNPTSLLLKSFSKINDILEPYSSFVVQFDDDNMDNFFDGIRKTLIKRCNWVILSPLVVKPYFFDTQQYITFKQEPESKYFKKSRYHYSNMLFSIVSKIIRPEYLKNIKYKDDNHFTIKHEPKYLFISGVNNYLYLLPNFSYAINCNIGIGNTIDEVLQVPEIQTDKDNKYYFSFTDKLSGIPTEWNLSEGVSFEELNQKVYYNSLSLTLKSFSSIVSVLTATAGFLLGGGAGGAIGGVLGSSIIKLATSPIQDVLDYEYQQSIRAMNITGQVSANFNYSELNKIGIISLSQDEDNKSIIEKDRKLYGDFINELKDLSIIPENTEGFIELREPLFNLNIENYPYYFIKKINDIFRRGVFFIKLDDKEVKNVSIKTN